MKYIVESSVSPTSSDRTIGRSGRLCRRPLSGGGGDALVLGEPKNPEVSVIIPMKDAADTVGETLDALTRQDFSGSFEILVVDNRSTDGSRDVVNRYAEALRHLRVIEATERPSASYARNVGARQARAPLLVFCDADDVADSGWLHHLVATSRGQRAVGGRLRYDRLNPYDPKVPDRVFQRDQLAKPMDFLPFSSTANLLVPASAFYEVGGFDEQFVGATAEDVDLSWRLQEAGWELVFAPKAVVQYRLRGRRRDELRKLHIYACDDPLIYKLHASEGARRRAARGVVYSWIRLLATVPACLVPTRRYGWLRMAAKQTGWVRGSFRHRVLYL
jgi:glycosyltransferase involved in cell wall biosynthesis